MARESAHYEHTRRSVASLIPYIRNARTHSDTTVALIASSIREFGFTNPVLIDEASNVIAGHGRVEAARKLGLQDVPCIVVTGLTDAQRRALILADNQIALTSGWNTELLKIEIAELQMADFDLQLLGFQPGQLADFIGGRDVEPPTVMDGPGATRRTDDGAEAFSDDDGAAPASSAREIDPDAYEMGCKCPRCGFEFDAK